MKNSFMRAMIFNVGENKVKIRYLIEENYNRTLMKSL
jgi:hypothetical protein